MNFDYVSLGSGLVGFSTLKSLILNVKNRKKKYNFALIDKSFANFLGGAAWSKKSSKHGFFNNPLRLSPKNFISDLKKKKSLRKEICDYLSNSKSFSYSQWLRINKKNFIDGNLDDELYLPRCVVYFWQKDQLISLLNFIESKKLKINIFFINKNINKIKIGNDKIFFEDRNYIIYKVIKKKLKFELTKKKRIEKIFSNFCAVGIGLPAPTYKLENSKKNKFYIWDFYDEGSTQNLIDKINLKKSIKRIKILFIGNKAGLLEPLNEIYSILSSKNILNVDFISKNNKSISAAQKSGKLNNKYEEIILKKINSYKYKHAIDVVNNLKKLFIYGKKFKLNNYDVWTVIMKNFVIKKILAKLDKKEKDKYTNIYFDKLRNITRFTYPFLVNQKKLMEKKKLIKYINFRADNLKYKNGQFEIYNIKKKYTYDIVVDVSGPANFNSLSKNHNLLTNLKKQLNFSPKGFKITKKFSSVSNSRVFFPGIISENYNPYRLTIFKALINNAKIVGKNISYNIR